MVFKNYKFRNNCFEFVGNAETDMFCYRSNGFTKCCCVKLHFPWFGGNTADLKQTSLGFVFDPDIDIYNSIKKNLDLSTLMLTYEYQDDGNFAYNPLTHMYIKLTLFIYVLKIVHLGIMLNILISLYTFNA